MIENDEEIGTAPHIEVGQEAGYIVLTETHHAWKDDWDGEVHASLADGLAALHDCRGAAYRSILVRCVRVEDSAAAVPPYEPGEAGKDAR